MKTAHCAEIFGVLIRLKQVLNPTLYAVGDVFQPFFIGLLFIFSLRLILSIRVFSVYFSAYPLTN